MEYNDNGGEYVCQQIVIAMANKLSPKDLHKVIFAHPTYSEGIGESILDLDSMAIHLPKK